MSAVRPSFDFGAVELLHSVGSRENRKKHLIAIPMLVFSIFFPPAAGFSCSFSTYSTLQLLLLHLNSFLLHLNFIFSPAAVLTAPQFASTPPKMCDEIEKTSCFRFFSACGGLQLFPLHLLHDSTAFPSPPARFNFFLLHLKLLLAHLYPTTVA